MKLTFKVYNSEIGIPAYAFVIVDSRYPTLPLIQNWTWKFPFIQLLTTHIRASEGSGLKVRLKKAALVEEAHRRVDFKSCALKTSTMRRRLWLACFAPRGPYSKVFRHSAFGAFFHPFAALARSASALITLCVSWRHVSISSSLQGSISFLSHPTVRRHKKKSMSKSLLTFPRSESTY